MKNLKILKVYFVFKKPDTPKNLDL